MKNLANNLSKLKQLNNVCPENGFFVGNFQAHYILLINKSITNMNSFPYKTYVVRQSNIPSYETA